MTSIRAFYSHPVTPSTGGSLLPGAILSTDSLLVLSGSALAARVFAGTDRGSRTVHWLQTHASWARHIFPFADVMHMNTDDRTAVKWGKTIVNSAALLLRAAVFFQGGAWIGPATLIASTHVFLGLAGLAAGANAGVLDHDVRAIKSQGAEAVIRERLVAGTDDRTMKQWLDAIAPRLARKSFRIRKTGEVVQQRRSLQVTLDQVRSDITAEQLRADIAARMADINRLADEHRAENPERVQGVLDKAGDIAQGQPTARTRERLEAFFTTLQQEDWEDRKKPESFRTRTPAPGRNGSRTAQRPVPATTTAPDPVRSSGSIPRPTELAVVRLLRKPPPILEFTDWVTVCNGHLHVSGDHAFSAIARFYQSHAALRPNLLRAVAQPPEEDNGHWEPLPHAAPNTYRHRLGSSHWLIGRQESGQFVITGIEG